ncbi:hypothetical protein Tco_1562529 [Tanacetum coccineum]
MYNESNTPLGGGFWDDDDGEMMAEVEVVLRCGDDGVGGDDVVRIVVVVAANNSGSDGEMYAVDVVMRMCAPKATIAVVVLLITMDGEMMAEVEVVLSSDDGVGGDVVVRIVVVVAANNSGSDGEMYAMDVGLKQWAGDVTNSFSVTTSIVTTLDKAMKFVYMLDRCINGRMPMIYTAVQIAVDSLRMSYSNRLGLEKGRYDVSRVFDMAYWGFLRVGTTFDIFQNILFPYGLNTAYWSFLNTVYWILFPSWSLVKYRHGYAISALMDTVYWLSEQIGGDDKDGGVAWRLGWWRLDGSVVGVVRRWWCGRRGDVVVVASVVVEAAKGWRLVLPWHGDRGGEGDGMMMVVRVCGSFGSFFLDVIKSLSLEYEHVAMNLTLLERGRFIIRTSLTGFPAQSVRSSNADALDSLYLLIKKSKMRDQPGIVLWLIGYLWNTPDHVTEPLASLHEFCGHSKLLLLLEASTVPPNQQSFLK